MGIHPVRVYNFDDSTFLVVGGFNDKPQVLTDNKANKEFRNRNISPATSAKQEKAQIFALSCIPNTLGLATSGRDSMYSR
jgi:hypothetical protein